MSQRVGRAKNEGGEPLLTIAARAVGLRKGFQVLTFMAQWDHARRAMRRETLTLHEYAEWWREPLSTAYRHQRHFREAFPAETTPDRLLDLAAVQWDERKGVRALGALVLNG